MWFQPSTSMESLHKRFFIVENGSLDFLNLLHDKKKYGSLKNCSLRGSLRSQKWFLFGITVKTSFCNHDFCFLKCNFGLPESILVEESHSQFFFCNSNTWYFPIVPHCYARGPFEHTAQPFRSIRIIIPDHLNGWRSIWTMQCYWYKLLINWAWIGLCSFTVQPCVIQA